MENTEKKEMSNKTKKSISGIKINAISTLFKRFEKHDKWLIAGIPILSYVVVYLYSYSYLSFFHIPEEFISFEINRIIRVFILIINLGVFLFIVGDPINSLIAKLPEFTRRKIRVVFPVLLIIIAYIVLYRKHVIYWVSGIIVLLVFFIIDILPILISQRKIKGFENKLIAYDRNRIKTEISTPLDKLFTFLGFQNALIIFCLFSVYIIGNANAMNQQFFVVTNTKPECAIIWNNGKSSICAIFDRKLKIVYPNFIILDNMSSNAQFEMEDIGPLKPTTLSYSNCIKCGPNEIYTFEH